MTMRIMLHTNAPWASTGYGNQAGLFAPRWKADGHEVGISATWGLEGAVINWQGGIPVFPRYRHPYGSDVALPNAMTFKADVLISLLDAWVFNAPDMGKRWVAWFPIDSEPVQADIVKAVSGAWKRVTISKFGHKMLENAGVDSTYIPHGVDTKAFGRGSMAEARKMLNLPEGAFIVGMVAANKGYPPRKAWVEQIRAFAKFKRKHPDALLYMHTDVYGDSLNLIQVLENAGLAGGVDYLVPDRYTYGVTGYSTNMMAALYNAFDVHMLVSAGEGFGIPLVEAQSCGCPVITGAWTACEELCFSGWKVDKKDATPFTTIQGADWYYPHVDAIVDKLCMAYEVRGNEDYRKRARDGAVAYDVDKVNEKYWRPFWAQVEAECKEQPSS